MQPSPAVKCGGARGEVEHSAGSVRLHRAAASELAVWNRSSFADGLAQLGLGARYRDEALRVRDDVAGEVRTLDDYYAAVARASYGLCSPPEALAIAEQRRSALQRLNDCLAD